MGNAIANQLVTALGNAGNVRIIDYDYFYQHRDKPSALVRRGDREVGPFVIRGSVTEFNEIAEATGSSTGGSAGALGAALGIAGTIAGNREAAIAGAALGLANPTYERTVARRTGSVAMDLEIVDAANGRVTGTVAANGSFTTESAANGFSLFGFGKASNAYAASALGQADRAAMNSATQQLVERLGSDPRLRLRSGA
jgi:curli biogenesis system outer membrane secretion channel CsgG